jgi:predicted Zn-ribbon and HTH transcriptional regulator
LPGPYSFSRMQPDEQVRKNASAEPISKDDYRHCIEAVAGNCRCGGKYTLDAPPRCPKCRSKRIDEGEIILIYD